MDKCEHDDQVEGAGAAGRQRRQAHRERQPLPRKGVGGWKTSFKSPAPKSDASVAPFDEGCWYYCEGSHRRTNVPSYQEPATGAMGGRRGVVALQTSSESRQTSSHKGGAKPSVAAAGPVNRTRVQQAPPSSLTRVQHTNQRDRRHDDQYDETLR